MKRQVFHCASKERERGARDNSLFPFLLFLSSPSSSSLVAVLSHFRHVRSKVVPLIFDIKGYNENQTEETRSSMDKTIE